jgi:His/Glu/Gln/Arg/opine family amino acid ABC transporter permease subunit
MNLDWQSIYDVRYYILEGFINTCLLTVIGIVLSSILGIFFSLLRISNNRLVRGILIAYIELWRNTPIVAQIFFLYFAMPLIGIKVSAFGCGLIALVLHFNAYNIEVFRAGLEAVPTGLEEASEALAFTYIQRLKLVYIPLAFRLSLPALVNNYVSLLKNTALVSVIGVVELTFVAQDVIADNFTFKEMYSTVALLYLILVFGLTWALRIVERKYAISL